MRPQRWRVPTIGAIALLALCACAKTAQPPSPAPASPNGDDERSEPNQRALRMPQILESLPKRPFIDLGPVMVHPSAGQGHSEFLLQTADRLHADAFVLERLELNDAYRGSARIEKLRQVFGRPNRNVGSVFHGPFQGPFQGAGEPKQPINGFYRALRYISPDQPACILELDGLEPDVAKALASAETLGEEHQILNELLAAGVIDDRRFLRLREQCIAQDTRSSVKTP